MAIFGKASWGRAHYSGGATPAIEAGFANLGAYVNATTGEAIDLSAELLTMLIKDLPAALGAISPEDLAATLQPNPGVDLPANTVPIPGVNLGAFAGGHLPEDLPTSLAAVLPVDLRGELGPVDSASGDLGGTITQVGGFKDMSGYLKTATAGVEDIRARIRVIAHGQWDLPASLQPFREADLTAAIITERILNLSGIIAGYGREVEANFPAIISRVDAQTSDLGVYPIRAVASTHTSAKHFNLDKVAHRFSENRYLFGTRSAGLLLLTLEPIFGTFPDLHAEIFARDFYQANIRAFVRPAIPDVKSLVGQLLSVEPFVNVNKLVLELIPLINMEAELVRTGGFLANRANITPVHSGVTGTASDAGFVTTASTYKFYLGTSGGLFTPPQIVPEIRIETFNNGHPLPDLHGTIAGWNESNLGAYIKDYSLSVLTASIRAFDIDHLSDMSAAIGTFNTADVLAQLTPSGAWEDIHAELTVAGVVSDFGANLIPAINPLAFNVVSVSTKPFKDLGAIINYESFVRCSRTSAIVALTAFIKPIVTGTPENQSDLPTSITSRRMELDLAAEVVGRKRTRVHVLNLTFRAKTRGSERVRASITPVAFTYSSMSAEIRGLLHEVDFPASLTPIRYAPHDVDFTAVERVANLESGDVKDILVSFRSQVNFYVYEEATDAVYATDRGTWAIDLRSLIKDEDFFDRSALSREAVLSDLQEFYSLDEALRYAIAVLCDRQQATLGASLSARGASYDLGVQIGLISADRLGDLPTKLVAVANSPDISAAISGQLSALGAVLATITPKHSGSIDTLSGSITGNVINNLGANIVAT